MTSLRETKRDKERQTEHGQTHGKQRCTMILAIARFSANFSISLSTEVSVRLKLDERPQNFDRKLIHFAVNRGNVRQTIAARLGKRTRSTILSTSNGLSLKMKANCGGKLLSSDSSRGDG